MCIELNNLTSPILSGHDVRHALVMTSQTTAARQTRRLSSPPMRVGSVSKNPAPVTENMSHKAQHVNSAASRTSAIRQVELDLHATPQCTTASVRNARCSGTARVDAPRQLRHALRTVLGRSLHVAPSSFNRAQPECVTKYGGKAVRREAPPVPSAPASFIRAHSSSLGDLAGHDAKECQGLPPHLKHRSDY
ncbi:hypothetical protein VTO73DRAFT_10369 [Trametes versicolor]